MNKKDGFFVTRYEQQGESYTKFPNFIVILANNTSYINLVIVCLLITKRILFLKDHLI